MSRSTIEALHSLFSRIFADDGPGASRAWREDALEELIETFGSRLRRTASTEDVDRKATWIRWLVYSIPEQDLLRELWKKHRVLLLLALVENPKFADTLMQLEGRSLEELFALMSSLDIEDRVGASIVRTAFMRLPSTMRQRLLSLWAYLAKESEK